MTQKLKCNDQLFVVDGTPMSTDSLTLDGLHVDRVAATLAVSPGAGGAIVQDRAGTPLSHHANLQVLGAKVSVDPSPGNDRITLDAGHVLATEFPGVDPTGATDSSAGLQDGIDALGSPAGTLLDGRVFSEFVFPAGEYLLSAQLNFTRLRGVTIRGAGIWATRFRWEGSAPGIDAAMLFFNCRECTVRDFSIHNVSNPPVAQIENRGDSTDPLLTGFVPTSMTWENLWLQGGAANGGADADAATLNSDYGWLNTYAGANAQNDLAKLRRVYCTQQNAANFGFGKGSGSAGSNMKNFIFDDCRGGFAPYGVKCWGGSFHVIGGYWFFHRTRTFTSLTADTTTNAVLTVASSTAFESGQIVAIDKGGADRQLGEILTVDSPTQITLTAPVTAASGSSVMANDHDEYADFARASTQQGVDVIAIEKVQSEDSAQLFVDCFDTGVANNLQVPLVLRDNRFASNNMATSGYATTLRCGGSSIKNCTYGELNQPPATVRIDASISYVGRYSVTKCKWQGSPLAGGGANPTNTPHLNTTGKALVEDGEHTFYNGTIPQTSEDLPAYPDKVATIAELRTLPVYKRIDGKRVAVTAENGRAFAYDSTTGANRRDDNATAARPSDVVATANGLWYEASNRVYVPDIEHLWQINTDRFSLVEVGGATGGTFWFDPLSTTADDYGSTQAVIAPTVSDTAANLNALAENDLSVNQFSAGGCSVATGTTLTDDTSTGSHVLSSQLDGLDITGTVETEILFDVQYLGGPITKLTFALANPGSAYNFRFDASTGLAAGAGALPTVTSTADGWYRLSITLTAEVLGNRLQWFLTNASSLVSYTGDGTGSLEIRRRIVRQKRTTAGRFVRQAP